MSPDDILRRIRNQRREHTPHPFKSGGAGLDDFVILHTLFNNVSDADLNLYLDEIDLVGLGHSDCISCSAKIAVFCEIFTRERLEDRNALYEKIYDDIVKCSQSTDRNFKEEVYQLFVTHQ
ncbi:hypothetical protein FEM03_12840 [Phragmitibacter flavus]|uniref:Uncharacterized protein n=1 Tax=Phragmitibacter flavus TaxID=2576071 RepID=A0A5R8KE60_9BACT|nr:hypothetical protein [Phragmitibacter flavus]TLD70598.1 hypothetical protein FEM03_12840 [Phragmitibacter flavus]